MFFDITLSYIFSRNFIEIYQVILINLLTDKQVSKICKAFANGSSVNIKFSRTGWLANLLEESIDGTKGYGITVTNSQNKDIMKVNKSLENKGILLKGNTGKITTQEGRFLNFTRPLMTADSP